MSLNTISIIAGGSRGDVQPYIAIGLTLKEAGYKVRILTNSNHRNFVESFNLCYAHVFSDVEEMLKNPNVAKSMADGDTFTFFKGFNEAFKLGVPQMSHRFHAEIMSNKPDLLIAGTLAEYFELYTGIHLGIPTLRIQVQALSYNKNRAQFGLPTLPFGLHYYIFTKVVINGLYAILEMYDDVMSNISGAKVLSRVDRKTFAKFMLKPHLPVLVCQSVLYSAELHPNIHSNYKFIGPCIVHTEQELKHPKFFGDKTIFERLEIFINADEARKPVYMGWGSLTCKSPEYMVVLAMEALREANQRGVILGGWANLSLDLLRKSTADTNLITYAEKNVFFADMVPHEWLFSRVAAVVHHGGAGTTNASLRSGVPTIITPIFLDQFDNAYVVEQLGVGVGFSTQLQKISSKELGRAIRRVLCEKDNFRERALSVSKQIRSEDGSSNIVKEVESYWKEYVVSNKWNQKLASNLLKEGTPGVKGGMTKKLMILSGLVAIVATLLSFFTAFPSLFLREKI